MKRVVVTGIGAVTPIGNTFEESWKHLVQGVSGLTKIDRFDMTGLPFTYAGQVRNLLYEKYLSNKEQLRYDLFVHYAFIAAQQAIDDAGLQGLSVQGKAGVLIGSSRAGISSLDRSIRQQLGHGGKISPYLMPSTTTSMAASFISQKYGYYGECEGISSACASGLIAVGNAFRLIRQGLADVIIAGGSEAPLCRLCVEGYGRSGALSKKQGPDASSPFDVNRDGFVLSEGACIMVFEEYESAKKRGAEIYGEVTGYAVGTDAYHQTKPLAAGESRIIEKALLDAGIKNDSVQFVSAHAPSTKLGDIAESDALQCVFGEMLRELPVSAFKSTTGHMLAASGAFEAASTLMVLKEGIVPPTMNLREIDPSCQLNIITSEGKIDADHAVVNSFGFGGVNAVLVIKRASRGS